MSYGIIDLGVVRLLWFRDPGKMATSSYRNYEVEAKDIVVKLLESSVNRIREEECEKEFYWSSISEFNKESVERAIEQCIEVCYFLYVVCFCL